MSIWSDIQDRSDGSVVRKEDEIQKNLWCNAGKYFNISSDLIKRDINELLKQNIQLSDEIADLRRELNKFEWDLKYKL